MTFQASKKREKKAPAPIGRGKPLIPSVPIRNWYNNQLNSIITACIADYKKTMQEAMENDNVKQYFATDSSATSVFKKTLEKLNRKWNDIFKGFAKTTSRQFTEKSDDYSKTSTVFSLSAAGIDQPTTAYNQNVENTLNAAQDFNNTLIVGIQEEVHNKIYESVMLSLTSPNPEEQGQAGIEAALKNVGGFAKDRAKLISRDQTSKLYSSLNTERMRQNGVEEFEWMHSSAGKVPRKSHVEKDGEIFTIDDPRLWEGNKSDRGPPGWAINCRCRARPIIR